MKASELPGRLLCSQICDSGLEMEQPAWHVEVEEVDWNVRGNARSSVVADGGVFVQRESRRI